MSFNEKKFKSSANWQKIAKNQLARHPWCAGCEEAPAAEVDHVVPISQGGAPRDRANLQSLCGTCHRGKTNAEREGKTWIPPKHRGCDEFGNPRDPNHPWNNEGEGDASLERLLLERGSPTKFN